MRWTRRRGQGETPREMTTRTDRGPRAARPRQPRHEERDRAPNRAAVQSARRARHRHPQPTTATKGRAYPRRCPTYPWRSCAGEMNGRGEIHIDFGPIRAGHKRARAKRFARWWKCESRCVAATERDSAKKLCARAAHESTSLARHINHISVLLRIFSRHSCTPYSFYDDRGSCDLVRSSSTGHPDPHRHRFKHAG